MLTPAHAIAPCPFSGRPVMLPAAHAILAALIANGQNEAVRSHGCSGVHSGEGAVRCDAHWPIFRAAVFRLPNSLLRRVEFVNPRWNPTAFSGREFHLNRLKNNIFRRHYGSRSGVRERYSLFWECEAPRDVPPAVRHWPDPIAAPARRGAPGCSRSNRRRRRRKDRARRSGARGRASACRGSRHRDRRRASGPCPCRPRRGTPP